MEYTLRRSSKGWGASLGLPQGYSKDLMWATAITISQTACQGNVSLNQIVNPTNLDALPPTLVKQAQLAQSHRTILFVIFNETESRRTKLYEAKGFLMANHDAEGLQIDILCATSPYGSPLLDAFLQRATEKNENVTLSALPTVLTQQPRFGFEFRASCNSKAVQLPSDLEKRIQARVAARTMPDNLTEAYKDRDWSDLLLFLQEKQLNVNKKGLCKKRKVSKNDLVADNCGVDGYTMKRCISI